MTTAMGIGDSWHTDQPATEAEAFERVKLKPGEETIVSGAFFLVDGEICFPSRVAKTTENELAIFAVDLHGRARVLTAHRDGAEIFAIVLSLAW